MENVNSIGRRKTSVARVILSEGSGEMIVNGRDGKEYFPTGIQQHKINQPFKLTETEGKYDVYAKIDGGGRCERRRETRPGDRESCGPNNQHPAWKWKRDLPESDRCCHRRVAIGRRDRRSER